MNIMVIFIRVKNNYYNNSMLNYNSINISTTNDENMIKINELMMKAINSGGDGLKITFFNIKSH